jgi:hypothetical protein
MDWIRFSKREIEADALPQVCMDCGEPASCRVSKTFEYVPDWAALLLLAGILPGIIALIVLQRQMRVSCPLCEKHATLWRTKPLSLRVGWLIIPAAMLVCGALVHFAWMMFGSATNAWTPFLLGLLSGGLASASGWGIWVGVDYAGRGRVKATKITPEEIFFQGLSEGFVKAARERQQLMQPPFPPV